MLIFGQPGPFLNVFCFGFILAIVVFLGVLVLFIFFYVAVWFGFCLFLVVHVLESVVSFFFPLFRTSTLTFKKQINPKP